MKKDYCKPDTWLVNLMSPYALLGQSKVPSGGGNNDIEPGEEFSSSRYGFWDDFDEDLLEDMSREEINELD